MRKLIEVFEWFEKGRYRFSYGDDAWDYSCYLYIHSYTVNGEDKTENLLKAIANIGYDRMNEVEYKRCSNLLDKQAELEALSYEIENEEHEQSSKEEHEQSSKEEHEQSSKEEHEKTGTESNEKKEADAAFITSILKYVFKD